MNELVKRWAQCLDYESSLKIVQEIAALADLPKPVTYEQYYLVLLLIDVNHPEAYEKVVNNC